MVFLIELIELDLMVFLDSFDGEAQRIRETISEERGYEAAASIGIVIAKLVFYVSDVFQRLGFKKEGVCRVLVEEEGAEHLSGEGLLLHDVSDAGFVQHLGLDVTVANTYEGDVVVRQVSRKSAVGPRRVLQDTVLT